VWDMETRKGRQETVVDEPGTINNSYQIWGICISGTECQIQKVIDYYQNVYREAAPLWIYWIGKKCGVGTGELGNKETVELLLILKAS